MTWSSPEEFLSDSGEEFVGIRSLVPGSGQFRAFVHRDDVVDTVMKSGLKPGDYILSKTIPPNEVVIAGELTWMDGNWVFYHSFEPLPMRDALSASGRHAVGYMRVWGLLGRYCTPDDVEDLHSLFEQYSRLHIYPVIELTVTRSDCGIYPGRNTLIWEVRHY
jgi:hypothetical protein